MPNKKSFSRRCFLRDASITGAILAQRSALPSFGAQPGSNATISEHVLFFDQPAATWPDALPVGNGRLGAMVFGNPANERLQLNEETVWMGEYRDRNNPQANRTPEVRESADGRQGARGGSSCGAGDDGRSRSASLLPDARRSVAGFRQRSRCTSRITASNSTLTRPWSRRASALRSRSGRAKFSALRRAT